MSWILLLLVSYVAADCQVGQYSVGDDLTCKDCPQGYFSDSVDASLCTPCSVTDFQDQPGKSSCKACPSGFSKSVQSVINCTKCPTGQLVSAPPQFSCADECGSGSWQSGSVCSFCEAGQYYVGNANTCNACPSGFVKPTAGSLGCEACDNTTTNNADFTKCVACEAGHELIGTSCEPCVPGKYESGSVCEDCAAGRYSTTNNANSCVACEAGKYQSVPGQTKCEQCAAGKYSESGADFCTPCPIGKGASTSGLSNCTRCNTGEENEDGICVPCDAGTYSDEGVACQVCPLGYISTTQGANACTICPTGQYVNSTGSIACATCDATRTVNISGNMVTLSAYPNIRGPGSTGCCFEGCSNCAAGTYRDQDECKACPQGFVSEIGKTECTKCNPRQGEYSDIENGTECKQCAQGTYTADSVSCNACSQGFSESNFECVACPKGWYADEDTNAQCKQCTYPNTTVGTQSTSSENCSDSCKANQIVDFYGECQQCGSGRYVDKHACEKCPAGYYKDSPSHKDCTDCPSGYNTDSEGQSSCSVCPPSEKCGCPWGQFGLDANSCKNCPAGFFGKGTVTCTACPAAQFQDVSGQGACKRCAPGTFGKQVGLAACENCPSGQFQLFHASEACEDCPIGRFASEGLSECVSCPAGTSTDEEGAQTTADCHECATGQYESENKCEPCPEGMFQDEPGKTVCKSCASGKWSSYGSDESSDCFETSGLVTYTFGTIEDAKTSTPEDTLCEIRPNFVMYCPTCRCIADARAGHWAGPTCDECARGFATRYCNAICPGYDGKHDSTICNGNGRCWFGRNGDGLCYCGGKDVIDPSADNVFVDVQFCPAGQICPGYGLQEVQKMTYIPLYYLINYRQYTTFVLQMSRYTPDRGHMWFKRFARSKAHENMCSLCTAEYDDTVLTEVGYWNTENMYEEFPLVAQSTNGFHGENCQYECAVCLNKGKCVHSPHPYRYSYTIENTYQQQKFVILPTTACACTASIFDAGHMCCPKGFQPYAYHGKRGTTPYSRFTKVPYITSIDNDIDKGYYLDKDLYLEPGHITLYKEPEDGNIKVAEGRTLVDKVFKNIGPYNQHVYHGTTKELCRACPGLFGKGVRVGSKLIQTEQDAEEHWWTSPASSDAMKCGGVCDFYNHKSEFEVDFMGSVTDYVLLHRGRLCKASIDGFVGYDDANKAIDTIEDCVNYGLSRGALFVGWSPDFYFGGEDSDMVQSGENPQDFGTIQNVIQAVNARYMSAWARRTSDSIYTLVKEELPEPDTDSLYEVHPVIEKRCIAYAECEKLKPLNAYVARAFNVYSIEKGRGDERLSEASFNRFDTCFTFTKNYDHDASVDNMRKKIGNYLTEDYVQGQDPFLGRLCPRGYFCTQDSRGVGFKEACPVGHFQPFEGRTRTVKDAHCSRVNTNTVGCQPNLATKSTTDYVDKVCQRCPRDTYAPEGSYQCEECPSGKVKKISGQFDPNAIDIFNIPTKKTPYWFYMENEQGKELDDCAIVPPSVIHVPPANRKMQETPENNQFMPVVSCPFGYSSSPGSFIIEDVWNIENILRTNMDVMIPPYIYMDGNIQVVLSNVPCSCVATDDDTTFEVPDSREKCEEYAKSLAGDSVTGTQISRVDGLIDGLWYGCMKSKVLPYVEYNADETRSHNYPTNMHFICERVVRKETLMEEFVSTYCYECPGDSMTGPASGICSTCSANLIKKNMKLGLQKLVSNSETRMYRCGQSTDPNKPSQPIRQDEETPLVMTTTYNNANCIDGVAKGFTDCTTRICPVIEKLSTENEYDIVYEKDILSWYYLQQTNKMWEAQHMFAAIKDPSVAGSPDIELAINDCVLACSTVFDKSYNRTNGVKAVRVGYAVSSDDRTWCVCNEGDPSTPADAIGIAPNKDHTAKGLCRDVVTDATIKNENCIKVTDMQVLWYESVIVDDWATTNFPLCGLCSPGKFYTGSECQDCQKGRYTSDMIESMRDICQFCPAGYYQSSEGNSGCRECEPGQFRDTSGWPKCALCPTGYHQDEFKMNSCKHCTVGKVQTLEGQPTCSACSPGTYMPTNTSSTICRQCEPGRFEPSHQSILCKNCPTGYKQPNTGQTLCQKCEPGQYQNQQEETRCILCERGKYQNEEAKSSCKGCAGFRYSTKTSPLCDSNDDCKWLGVAKKLWNYWPSRSWNRRTVSSRQATDYFSRRAHYQDATGAIDCKSCNGGATCVVDQTPVVCPAGKAMPAGIYSDKCITCEKSTYSIADKKDCAFCARPNYVDALHASCSPCNAQTGAVPYNNILGHSKAGECGITEDDDACNACTTCMKITQKVSQHKCVKCPDMTPIRKEADGTQCESCGKNKFWDGTKCGKCPATGLSKDTSKGSYSITSTKITHSSYRGAAWDEVPKLEATGYIVTKHTRQSDYFSSYDDYIELKKNEDDVRITLKKHGSGERYAYVRGYWSGGQKHSCASDAYPGGWGSDGPCISRYRENPKIYLEPGIYSFKIYYKNVDFDGKVQIYLRGGGKFFKTLPSGGTAGTLRACLL